jgi:hypothetical protein
MVALITVALAFASNYLLLRMAESEFEGSRQFMQTLALQIDDVAWVIGQIETARYAGKYGDVALAPALNYTIYVNTTTQSNAKFFVDTTDVICFNMPISKYSIGNGYFEPIYPSSHSSFLSSGTSAPVARAFAVQKLPMADGDFVRVVVVPTIRMMNSSVGGVKYLRLYLPILTEGAAPKRSQSVTLTGEDITTKTMENVTSIKIELDFPIAGFDNFFFNFPQTVESVSSINGAVLELYVGAVDVALGVHA